MFAVIVPALTVSVDIPLKLMDPVEIEFVEIAPVLNAPAIKAPVFITFADIKFALRLLIKTVPAEILEALKFINVALQPEYISE